MKPIVFLAHEATRLFGSSLIRSEQMASLTNRTLEPRGIRVTFSVDPCTTDSLVILNKGYLIQATAKDLVNLKRNGNTIIADYVDLAPRREQMAIMDGLMACSLAQMAWFRKETPNIPAFHVTHKMDSRFPVVRPPSDAFRIAFFGFLPNAGYQDKLSNTVEFIETPGMDTRWMNSVSNYNCHYAVRRPQSYDGFKPFLKGFVAAHSQCPIVISTIDADALAYLGEEYPYLVKSDSLENVLEVLTQARLDFKGPRWVRALEVMEDIRRRSTDEFVMKEFETIVSYYTNM